MEKIAVSRLIPKDFRTSEALKALRTNLIFSGTDVKVIGLTSYGAAEGKSTLSFQTAMAFAQTGKRVLLVDADLRSQSVAQVLEEETEHDGLMECMQERPVSIFDCIRTNEAQKLDFISGRSTDKRHYTLNINKVNALMDQLRERYDYIIIDTPPNDLVSDAMALCRCANCVLYVVRQDYVKRNQIINSIVSMHAKGITISGCIFNGVPRYQRHYGYGYRYGYGYGYGRKKKSRYGFDYLRTKLSKHQADAHYKYVDDDDE